MLFEDDVYEHIREWLNGVPLDEHMAPQRIPCASEYEWLAARTQGIGASEAGVIVGASTFTSPYALWWRKKLDWRLPQTEGQRWGHLVEDPIAVLFAEEMADSLYVAKPAGHPYSLWRHPIQQWVMCTPDRLAVDRAGHVYPVEIKSDEGGDGWGEPGTDEVPRQYRCQALWQAYVFNATGTYVVRKRGSGKRRMVWYWVPYDRDDMLPLARAAAAFRQSIEDNNPPDPDGAKATTDTLKDINTVVPETFAAVPATLYDEWSAARAAKREAIAAEALLSNRMRAAMGTAEFATVRTHDGLDVVRVKRRVGKRTGYEVPPGTTDELREVGTSGQRATPDGVRPGDTSDGPAVAAAQEEGHGTGDSEGGTVGERTEGTEGRHHSGGVEVTDDLVERLADEAENGYDVSLLRPRYDGPNPYDLPPELARLVDLSQVDTSLLIRRPENDCGA